MRKVRKFPYKRQQLSTNEIKAVSIKKGELSGFSISGNKFLE